MFFQRREISEENKDRDSIYGIVFRADRLSDGAVRCYAEHADGDCLSDPAADL